jgi:hypothetical protein
LLQPDSAESAGTAKAGNAAALVTSERRVVQTFSISLFGLTETHNISYIIIDIETHIGLQP